MKIINEKQPRICEVLGVKEGQEFTADYERYVILNGTLWKLSYGEKQKIGGKEVCWLINNTERINRCKPRPTAEQLEELKWVYKIFKRVWIAKEGSGFAFGYKTRPQRDGIFWKGDVIFRLPGGIIFDLVSWADDEPLDVLQTLKDNGVEVE